MATISKGCSTSFGRFTFTDVFTLILAFVFLHEEFTAKSLIGSILSGAGTLIMVL